MLCTVCTLITAQLDKLVENGETEVKLLTVEH